MLINKSLCVSVLLYCKVMGWDKHKYIRWDEITRYGDVWKMLPFVRLRWKPFVGILVNGDEGVETDDFYLSRHHTVTHLPTQTYLLDQSMDNLFNQSVLNYSKTFLFITRVQSVQMRQITGNRSNWILDISEESSVRPYENSAGKWLGTFGSWWLLKLTTSVFFLNTAIPFIRAMTHFFDNKFQELSVFKSVGSKRIESNSYTYEMT